MLPERMGTLKVPRLFTTKTRVPLAPPGFVSRPRLLGALRAGVERKVTVVIAPAGFGKTTLLAELARALGPEAAWLSLDPSDNDLSVFAHYLVEAIGQAAPGFGAETRAWLAATPAPALQITDFAAILLGELDDLGDARLVLFLDDFHEVAGSENITRLLDLLTRYLSPHIHLVISGRVPPALTTTRLLVQQQIAGLGMEDLRFQPDEAEKWFAARTGKHDPAAIAQLVTASEGWITGMVLQLATDGLPARPGITSGQLYTYLSTEVLERQPTEIQHFLLRAAILTDLAVPVCNAVLEMNSAGELLEGIQEQQLFLTAVGGREAPVYRLHQLFREFLTAHLRAAQPQEFTRLQRRAATYYEQQADYGQAMEHLFAGTDWARAAALAVRVGPGELEAGRGERVEGWIARFPAPHRELWPALFLLEARLLAAGVQYGPAGDALAHGEHLLREAGDRPGYAEALALRARLAAASGDGRQMVEFAMQALAIVEASAVTRAQAQHAAAIGYAIAGDAARSDTAYGAALAEYTALGDRQSLALVASDWGFSLVERDELQRGAAQLDKALDYARQINNRRLQARVLSNLAAIHQARRELAQAQAHLAAALSLARQLRWRRIEAEILLGQAEIALALAGPQAALRLYELSPEIARHSTPTVLVRTQAGQAGCLRRLGRYADAARLARRGLETALAAAMAFEAALCRLELGAAILPHAPEEALPLLEEAERALLAQGRKLDSARAAAALATALAASYDYPAAAAALARAAAVADETGSAFFLAPELATASGLALLRYADSGSRRYTDLLAAVTHYLETENQEEAPAGPARADSPLQLVHGRPRVLEVYSFGPASVYRDGLLLAKGEWQTATARELFYYLIEYPEGRRKEVIMNALWPDQAPTPAGSNFHTSLKRLRHALGMDAVKAEDNVYRLNPALALWHDGAEVLALLARAHQAAPEAARRWWTAAAALLKGPYADEFYRDWAAERRRFWEMRTKEVLSWLADDALRRAAFDAAAVWAQQLVALDPCDEATHVLLMQIYAASGRTALVIQQYKALAQVLDAELGIAPSRETQALYARLLLASGPPA